jgi:hypothetical protein
VSKSEQVREFPVDSDLSAQKSSEPVNPAGSFSK